MQDTDRFIVRMPSVQITKVTVAADGTPVFQEFNEFKGVDYPGMTYEMVVGIQRELVALMDRLQKYGEAALVQSQGAQTPAPRRTGTGG